MLSVSPRVKLREISDDDNAHFGDSYLILGWLHLAKHALFFLQNIFLLSTDTEISENLQNAALPIPSVPFLVVSFGDGCLLRSIDCRPGLIVIYSLKIK